MKLFTLSAGDVVKMGAAHERCHVVKNHRCWCRKGGNTGNRWSAFCPRVAPQMNFYDPTTSNSPSRCHMSSPSHPEVPFFILRCVVSSRQYLKRRVQLCETSGREARGWGDLRHLRSSKCRKATRSQRPGSPMATRLWRGRGTSEHERLSDFHSCIWSPEGKKVSAPPCLSAK